jgi:hypothetical protein
MTERETGRSGNKRESAKAARNLTPTEKLIAAEIRRLVRVYPDKSFDELEVIARANLERDAQIRYRRTLDEGRSVYSSGTSGGGRIRRTSRGKGKPPQVD